MLLVGSLAAYYRGFNFSREPKDVDVIATDEDVQAFLRKNKGHISAAGPIDKGKKYTAVVSGKRWEFELAWEGTTAKGLLELVDPVHAVLLEDTAFTLPDPEILYALKMSHRYLRNSPAFLKTMRDIQYFRWRGINPLFWPQALWDWYKARQKETYNYAHPKLDVGKADFFKGDGVPYLYDHDTVHLAVKNLEKPAYTYFKKEGSEVACDKEKFFAASQDLRLYSVLEEACVLALERSQIPCKEKPTPLWSFTKALEKVCTSITSGWWREFAWENYDAVMALYDPSYVDRFWKAVADGLVLPGPDHGKPLGT